MHMLRRRSGSFTIKNYGTNTLKAYCRFRGVISQSKERKKAIRELNTSVKDNFSKMFFKLKGGGGLVEMIGDYV
jgi:hypothetical protein